MPVYPLSNIAVFDKPSPIEVKIQPGDMLYIPSCWFHKVLTLEDGTMNINYVMFNKNNPNISTFRHRQLFNLHKMFTTRMDTEVRSIYTGDCLCFLYGFVEMIPVYLVVLALYYGANYYNVVPVYLVVLIVICYLLWYSQRFTSGISKLIAVYLFIFTFCLSIYHYRVHHISSSY